MYRRKQSLVHLPMPWIRYLGHPIAAAVDAAPIRREWEEMFTAPSEVFFSVLLMSERVRNVPLLNTNSGPRGFGCWDTYRRSALTGHSMVLFASILTVTPCLKGSVLEVFR